MLTMANNHAMDNGVAGLRHTLDVLDSHGLAHVGAYRNAQERQQFQNSVIIEQKGIRVALLAYTYGLNCTAPDAEPEMVSRIEQEQMSREVAAARAHNVHKVIVSLHLGMEYTFRPRYDCANPGDPPWLPQARQLEACRWLLDNGLDIVVGSQPHAPQPMEHRQPGSSHEKQIASSLGDTNAHHMLAPDRLERRGMSANNRGIAGVGAWLRFALHSNDAGEVRLKDVGYRLSWRHCTVLNGVPMWHIMPAPPGGQPVEARDLKGLAKEDAEDVVKSLLGIRHLYQELNINVPEVPAWAEWG